MSKILATLVAAGCVLVCLYSGALADANADYRMLFGQEDAKAAASRNTRDAADFAAKLLKAANSLSEQKDLQALLCEKAYEFGLKSPSGQQTAAEAMKSLMEVAPEKKAQAQERLLKLYQTRYAKSAGDERKRVGQELLDLLAGCGDELAAGKQPAEALVLYRQALSIATTDKSERIREILDKIKQVSSGQESARKLKTLKARLESDPKDAAARTELIVAYLGEFDNPAEAVKLLASDLDERLRTYLPLSAKPVEELQEAACLELGNWYAELADKASAAGKGVLLGRAKGCCERYLELHTAQDVARLKGKMLLDKVAKGAASVTARPVTGSPRIITLDLGKGVTMKVALIPAGKFMMGSPENEKDHWEGESPQHQVTLTKPFYMGLTEVTQVQYEAVIGSNPSESRGPRKPVERVSWDEAAEFCSKLSAKTGKTVRLPTEAQWEYACRAGTTTRFSFGDNDDELRNYGNYGEDGCDDGFNRTAPVGSFKPNGFGLYDMHGNVCEWTSDFSSGTYSNAKDIDPTGPEREPSHVIRGGAWNQPPARARSAYRIWVETQDRRNDLGFRVMVVIPDLAGAEKPKPEPRPIQTLAQPDSKTSKTLTLDLGKGVTMKVALIPAGKFMMGSPAGERGRATNEGPQHEVTISKPFHTGIFEVTQAQYEAVMGTNPSKFKGDNRPVEKASWNDAVEFCKKVSQKTGKAVRLPTEAEWEYACRAGTKTRFCFGDDEGGLGAHAWHASNSESKTHPAGEKKPDAFGLHDMHGNVWEWCSDWYADSYANAKGRDPEGPISGTQRVLRGGSWDDGPRSCRSGFRNKDIPDARGSNNGFRVVVVPDRAD